LDDRPDVTDPRLARAAEVIRVEARTIAALEGRLDRNFVRAVEMLLGCEGQVVVTGIGKAGLVGQKISATLASTGTPSIFLHPSDALHGDLGRIRRRDIVLAISNSGESSEVNAVIPPTRKIGAGVIALTGQPEGALAKLADCVLDIGTADEACPLKLAPTASTSALMTMGDALAMVVMQERRFSREDYALFHPAGSLGRRLMRVREVMRTGEELPLVALGTRVMDVLLKMSRTRGKPGAALVVDAAGKLSGIFTDGDLRRLLIRDGKKTLEEPIGQVMTRNPKHLKHTAMVRQAVQLMRETRIDEIPVIDDEGKPLGLIDVQDLMALKVIEG
jgi:arabinose-5-phosphate isomerase